MRIRALLIVASMSLFTTNCVPRQEPDPEPIPLLRYHFLGAQRVTSASDAVKLKTLSALPETRTLVNHFLNRLAQSPASLSGNTLGTNSVPLLRPLLDDLWKQESSLLLQRTGPQKLDWTLAVHLNPDRLLTWRSHLVRLAENWQLGQVRQGMAGNRPTVIVGDTDSPVHLRWVEAGSWGLLGIGHPSLPGLAHTLQQFEQSQTPHAPLSNTWLHVTANLPHLAASLGLNTNLPWPTIQLELNTEGETIRTSGNLEFPTPQFAALEPWLVPTNTISDPLCSFTAARGVAPLLEKLPFLQQLGIDPIPNRVFAWALDSLSGQSYLAFPLPGVTNILPKLALAAPAVLPPEAATIGLTRFDYTATNKAVHWRGFLPVITPSLTAVRDQEMDYALLSLFPSIHINPPPQALLDQLSETNLVFYQWELTELRLAQWITMSQVASVMTRTPQLSPQHPPLRWLQAIAPHLGNTATEITLDSPNRLSFRRKSHLGLSGLELVWLGRWLDSASFPRPGIALPPTPKATGPSTPPASP